MNNIPHKPGSLKNTIIMVSIVVVAFLLFFYFSGKDTPEGTLTLDQSSPQSSADAARILNLLNQIQSLRIDTSLFKATAYQTLVDYSVTIPEVPVGRPNPFAPLPGVSAASTQ